MPSISSAPAAPSAMCKDYDTEFLGALPLEMAIREMADNGQADGRRRAGFESRRHLPGDRPAGGGEDRRKAKDMSTKFPSIVVQNT